MEYKIENPFPGVHIYKNVLKKELDLINRLEKIVKENEDQFFQWRVAEVGDFQRIPEYRDCVDFKVQRKQIEQHPKGVSSGMLKLYDDINTKLHECLDNYCATFNITMKFQEAVNFVRYGIGHHFAVHPDSGAEYTCAVSSVMYLNDNYKGGELYFPFINYTYIPEEGDVVLFPSAWIFSHASLPVTEGVKYSAVTMFDYTDRFHTDEYYQWWAQKYGATL